MTTLQIRSDTAGLVWQISVKAAHRVSEGDELIVLESMKMELPIVAPRAGTVLSIEVAEGAQVNEGDLVAVLEIE